MGRGGAGTEAQGGRVRSPGAELWGGKRAADIPTREHIGLPRTFALAEGAIPSLFVGPRHGQSP